RDRAGHPPRGRPEAPVRKVVVSGGAGDSLFDAVRATGADAFLTADLRHHPASEATEHGPLGLIDAAHWATEWPWCEQAAAQLDEISDRHGWELRVHVSKTVTDPWSAHFDSTGRPQLNAAPADQVRLLDLQALDTRLGQLAHRKESLPEHAELTGLGKDATGLRDLLVAARTEEGDTAREQTKAEQDVDQVRTRATRDQQRLDSGAVTSPKDLENLQREIASLAKRQGDLEDVVLEIMERRESAQSRVAELTERLGSVETRVAEVTERRDAAASEIDAETATVAKERAVVAGSVPDTPPRPLREAARPARRRRRGASPPAPLRGLPTGAEHHRGERGQGRQARRRRPLRELRAHPGPHLRIGPVSAGARPPATVR
ncbi:Predicted nucleic acid-binding protein, contains Zn-ribbon domain, partial [Streptomyces sp. SolWspMP-sol7th]